MRIKELKDKIANIDGDIGVFLKVTIKDEDGNELKMDLTIDDLTTEYGLVFLSPGKIINADETNEELGGKATLDKIKSLAQKGMDNCEHAEEYKALFEIHEFIDDMEMEAKDAI